MAHTFKCQCHSPYIIFERIILLVELSFSYLSSMFKYFLALSHVTNLLLLLHKYSSNLPIFMEINETHILLQHIPASYKN